MMPFRGSYCERSELLNAVVFFVGFNTPRNVRLVDISKLLAAPNPRCAKQRAPFNKDIGGMVTTGLQVAMWKQHEQM